MWVVNDKLRNAERNGKSDILFYITHMNPDDALTQAIMMDYKIKTEDDRRMAYKIGYDLAQLIQQNAKIY